MHIQSNPKRSKELVKFVVQVLVLATLCVSVILSGTYGVFDRTLFQMILAGTALVLVLIVGIGTVVCESLD